jgi:hypothetical protein
MMKVIELYPHGLWTKKYVNAYMVAVPPEFVIAVSFSNIGTTNDEKITLTICGPVGLPYNLELKYYTKEEIYKLLGWTEK